METFNGKMIILSGITNDLGDEAIAFYGLSDFGTDGWFLGVRENDEKHGNPMRTKFFLELITDTTTVANELAKWAKEWAEDEEGL